MKNVKNTYLTFLFTSIYIMNSMQPNKYFYMPNIIQLKKYIYYK